MRIAATFSTEKEAKRFSAFLKKQGIDNSVEIQFNPAKRASTFTIWVHDEDNIAKAENYFEEFSKGPLDAKFNAPEAKEDVKKQNDTIYESVAEPTSLRRSSFINTIILIFICVFLFILDFMQEWQIASKYQLKGVQIITKLDSELMFEYPKAQMLLNDVIIQYNLNTEEKLTHPPQEAAMAISKIESISEWRGFYPMIIRKIKDKISFKSQMDVPIFTNIKDQQYWRFITPCFLHKGLLHILFNMLWLWILGKEIEPRLRFFRYFLLIVIVGVVSNTFQYLMSGPLFLGFSGIIAGMAGFIWSRQKAAPWEGYPLAKPVINFLVIFVLAMVALQLISFVMQIFDINFLKDVVIANTAHIAGGIVGIILGRIPFFAWVIK